MRYESDSAKEKDDACTLMWTEDYFSIALLMSRDPVLADGESCEDSITKNRKRIIYKFNS